MGASISNLSIYTSLNYIGGVFQQPLSSSFFQVENPASGEVLAQVEMMDPCHHESVVQHAHQAFQEWSQKSASDRSEFLYRLYQKLLDHKDEFATLISSEQGKSVIEAKGEVQYAANFFQWYAEEARRIYGDTIPGPSSKDKIMVLRSPVGVCAAITPWNFPLAMIARKLAPALAAGCSMILKPSELTPLSALALAKVFDSLDAPKGLFQVINGDPQTIGEFFCTHPQIRKITFTGSTEVGKLLMKQSSSTVKNISLELGGNAPFLVFEDADLDAAVEGAMQSKFRNTGQTCVCSNRFLVHDSVLGAFVKKMMKAMDTLRTGSGLDEQHEICPLINHEGLEKVKRLVTQAIDQGAVLHKGGQPLSMRNGYAPTLLTGIKSSMDIFKEEIFGPVVAITTFRQDQEALELANDTHYGLAAYCYTQSLSRSWYMAENLEYGMVGINKGIISDVASPFGGVKQSGLGREGSKYGLDEYVEKKTISIRTL
ncbi:MAG: NAD-dependent succinate-semialdehyde dehydrogenase [Bdellovibrionota bacterium]